MYKYLLITILLVLALTLSAQPSARIGNRHFDESELEEGFEAYLTYLDPGDISARDSLALFSRYFDELIGMHIYNSAVAEGMIQVSEAELEQEISNNPPQGMLNIPDFQSDGSFDIEKYRQALRQNPAFKESMLNFSREVFAYRKLVNHLKSKATIDSLQVKKDWIQQGSRADARIIVFDYNKLGHITADSTDARVLYEQNRENYRREKGRKLLYVWLKGESSRSSADRLIEIEQNSRDLHAAAVQKGLASAARELAYEPRETHYFSAQDEIVRGIGKDKELIASVFAARPGDVLPLYKNPFGDYFVIQVIAEAEEYYLPFENERDLLQLQARAEKRKAALKDYVHQFLFQHEYEQYLDAAQQEGLRIVDAKDISLGTDIEGIGNVDVLKRTILSSPELAFAPLVEHDGLYYLAWVQKRSIRNERAWKVQKEEVLQQALTDAQNQYLDDWYRQRFKLLDIEYPPALQGIYGN